MRTAGVQVQLSGMGVCGAGLIRFLDGTLREGGYWSANLTRV